MATHSSTLAWNIPWAQSMASLRVGHDWVTSLPLFTFMHWRRKWQPTPVFLPGESQGQGSLVGCCLGGHTELDMTELLHFHFSLWCTGEGNGNPLQCSCLESPRDRGAWWAAIHVVAQSWTRLKWLSSSSRGKRCMGNLCTFLFLLWIYTEKQSFVFSFFLKKFYWIIVDLQCFVSFGCTAKWMLYI